MSTLSIQLPDSILHHAERLAQDEGVSVNQLVSSALAEKLSALDAERYLRERAERGKTVDIDAILAKVPDVPPQPGDELPPGYVSPLSQKWLPAGLIHALASITGSFTVHPLDMDTVTLSPEFQVVIPKAIREALHLTAGEEFRVLQYAGRVELIPVRPIQEMRGFLRGMDTTIEREADRLWFSAENTAKIAGGASVSATKKSKKALALPDDAL